MTNVEAGPPIAEHELTPTGSELDGTARDELRGIIDKLDANDPDRSWLEPLVEGGEYADDEENTGEEAVADEGNPLDTVAELFGIPDDAETDDDLSEAEQLEIEVRRADPLSAVEQDAQTDPEELALTPDETEVSDKLIGAMRTYIENSTGAGRDKRRDVALVLGRFLDRDGGSQGEAPDLVTLEELSADFGNLSRERIRAIITRTLGALRQDPALRELVDLDPYPRVAPAKHPWERN